MQDSVSSSLGKERREGRRVKSEGMLGDWKLEELRVVGDWVSPQPGKWGGGDHKGNWMSLCTKVRKES